MCVCVCTYFCLCMSMCVCLRAVVCIWVGFYSVFFFLFLCRNFAETDFIFSALTYTYYWHTQPCHILKVWMDTHTHTVTHTLHALFIKSRGFRSPLLPVFSELKSKRKFPFSFLPSQNSLFSFLPSSAVSFQGVCCSRPLFDPPPSGL